jgi:hypothetical protein
VSSQVREGNVIKRSGKSGCGLSSLLKHYGYLLRSLLTLLLSCRAHDGGWFHSRLNPSHRVFFNLFVYFILWYQDWLESWKNLKVLKTQHTQQGRGGATIQVNNWTMCRYSHIRANILGFSGENITFDNSFLITNGLLVIQYSWNRWNSGWA